MYRGQVTAVDAKGVYVLVPSLHPTAAFGPLDHVGAQPAVGARVLVADCGDESAPDLVVMTGSGPTSSTDNAIARYDGTGGALQDSSVTIDDGGYVTVPGTNAGIDVNGSATSSVRFAGAYSQVEFRNQTGDARWVLAKNGGESGDSGSDLEIDRFDSGGGHVSLVVSRSTGRWSFRDVDATAGLELGSSGPRDMAGTGSPEGVVTAPKGSTWRRTDGGAGTTFWVKESGSGNTGWVAK